MLRIATSPKERQGVPWRVVIFRYPKPQAQFCILHSALCIQSYITFSNIRKGLSSDCKVILAVRKHYNGRTGNSVIV